MGGSGQAVKVGAFVILGALLFGVGLFLIGDRRLLFVANEHLETTFSKVTGLQVGTRVRLAGMNAGEVTAIEVPARPSDPFLVRFRIRRDLLHLVRADSVASVQTDGIVGNAFVQVSPGSDEAAPVSGGSRIRGADAIEFGDVLAEANRTLASFREFVDEISDDVNQTLRSVTQTVDTLNQVAGDIGKEVAAVTDAANSAVSKAERVADEGSALLTDLRQGKGTIGKLFADDALYTDLRAAARRTEESVEQARGLLTETRTSLQRVLGPGGTAEAVLEDMRGTTRAAEEVLTDLAETTEAFKRNFLVRGFFQRRGYYDINALTPAEYRRFAGDTTRRTALRIWLDGAQLFVRDDRGVERLTAEGRARIDLAMGTLLEQRRDSPLIVEGYATGGSTAEQFVRSDARARLVRDHVKRQFRRSAGITGSIGLASDAQGSPSGDGRWDGVALTLFVSR